MSRPKDWIKIDLAPERIARAKQRAAKQLKNYPDDRGDFSSYGGPPRPLRLEWSEMAAEAIAQHMKRTSVPGDVKSQWDSHSPEKAHLKIPREECEKEPGKRWVLVTGREPTFKILGGIRAHEAGERGEWREGKGVPRPAHFVPVSELHAGVGKVSA
jgi:hypothetical protein